MNEEVRSNLKEVPTVPFKDKIEELESVLQSISSMKLPLSLNDDYCIFFHPQQLVVEG